VIALALVVMISMGMLNATAFDSEVGKLVKELGYLESSGLNVSSLVEELDKAVKLYYSGERSKALRILQSIEASVSKLKPLAREAAARRTMEKAITVAALASAPIAVYLLLPRAYLYLWYRLRRKWIVEGAS